MLKKGNIYKVLGFWISMFGWLFGRKVVDGLKRDVSHSFSAVKQDIDKIGEWIKHLHTQDGSHKNDLATLKRDIDMIKKDLYELRKELQNTNSMSDPMIFKQLFKTSTRVNPKQTAVEGVQTPVQTAVQTADLSSFSVMERALVYILLNSDLKLSYDDLAAMMGKSRATVRGQINSIKQKNEGLVLEQVERNGKKRVYIPEDLKDKMLKNVKVKAKDKRR